TPPTTHIYTLSLHDALPISKDVVARVQRGRILLSSGKTEEAISELRQRVAEAPDSAQAHHYLGIAYWQSGEVAQAQSELQEALRSEEHTSELQSRGHLVCRL